MCSLCVYPFCSKTLSLRFRCAKKSKLPLELMCKTRGQHKSALQRVQGESFRCPAPSPKMAPWCSGPAAISLRSPPHPPWWLTDGNGMWHGYVQHPSIIFDPAQVHDHCQLKRPGCWDPQQTVLDNRLHMGEGSRKNLWVAEWIHWICF